MIQDDRVYILIFSIIFVTIILALKQRWVCKRGKELHLITKMQDYSLRYKLVKGIYTKKVINDGRIGDDLYREITIFKPKTKEARILVWVNNRNWTDKYLIILRKDYSDRIKIN